MASWCDHPASKAICRYGLPAAEVYCAYCSTEHPSAAPGAYDPFPMGGLRRHGGSILDCPTGEDFRFNPELYEDPDNRPYSWDLPEGDCKCH